MTCSDNLAALTEFMGKNGWVSSRRELLARGFALSAVKNWLRTGRLVRLFHGVYGYARDIETRKSAWRAALLVAGPGSALTGASACEHWGLVRQVPGIPRLVVVASPARAKTHVGLSPALAGTKVRVIHRMIGGELRRSKGIDVASPVQVLVDFAGETTPDAVRFAFLEACRLGLFGRSDLDRCFRLVEGRRGAARLRPLFELWVPELGRIRSVLEGLFLLAWIDHGHRVPLVNSPCCGYEVDCYWPDQGLVLELDGGAFHSDPLARARDAAKDQTLRDHGLQVMRIPYEAVRSNPAEVVRKVASALNRNSR